ncbi:reverse transcriptase [Absiella sp. AM27-20]|uniref:Reverse transcriptase n=2 Tax=Erysipelotrichales TaxID=526525 RepID=A0A7G9GNL3_9FIRM|nr:reverse transcriptase [[Eubacterium] hominis]RHU10640.1 reverse transcriptase [Absiella sp. AM27-20]
MKRYGNLWSEICSMENLRKAHKKARKGKAFYREVKMVDQDPEKYLSAIRETLLNKTFKTSEYTIFERKEGNKLRLIYKLPYYPDRIVQWAIMLIFEPILIKGLTNDTYSAIPGRGAHKALLKLKKELNNDVQGTQYCLKLDMQKYYQSIPHRKLKEAYRRRFKDPDLLWALDEIIDSTEGEIGIPIGNYISQYSGNVYLSSLDHWLKEDKRIKHYFRYMDDMVILHESKEFLHDLYEEINTYASETLGITVKDNWQVFPTNIRGVDFLGYRVFKDFVLLRKSTAKNLKRKMRSVKRKIENGGRISYTDYCSFNSYKGWLKYCDSFRLYEKYMAPLEESMREYYERQILKLTDEEKERISYEEWYARSLYDPQEKKGGNKHDRNKRCENG